tara:strand:+ start:234 stop:464 length:231 start_codon:yes stop_codon:yes gene_type:complete
MNDEMIPAFDVVTGEEYLFTARQLVDGNVQFFCDASELRWIHNDASGYSHIWKLDQCNNLVAMSNPDVEEMLEEEK